SSQESSMVAGPRIIGPLGLIAQPGRFSGLEYASKTSLLHTLIVPRPRDRRKKGQSKNLEAPIEIPSSSPPDSGMARRLTAKRMPSSSGTWAFRGFANFVRDELVRIKMVK